jgi:hypothetical protein
MEAPDPFPLRTSVRHGSFRPESGCWPCLPIGASSLRARPAAALDPGSYPDWDSFSWAMWVIQRFASAFESSNSRACTK